MRPSRGGLTVGELIEQLAAFEDDTRVLVELVDTDARWSEVVEVTTRTSLDHPPVVVLQVTR